MVSVVPLTEKTPFQLAVSLNPEGTVTLTVQLPTSEPELFVSVAS